MNRLFPFLLLATALSSNAASTDVCAHIDDQVSERECNVSNAQKSAKEVENEEVKVREAIVKWNTEPESKKLAITQLAASVQAYRTYRDKTCSLSSAPAMYGRGQEDMRLICAYELDMAFIKRLQDVSRGFGK